MKEMKSRSHAQELLVKFRRLASGGMGQSELDSQLELDQGTQFLIESRIEVSRNSARMSATDRRVISPRVTALANGGNQRKITLPLTSENNFRRSVSARSIYNSPAFVIPVTGVDASLQKLRPRYTNKSFFASFASHVYSDEAKLF